MRFRTTIRLASDAGSETRQGAPRGAPCPSLFARDATKNSPRAWRGNECACANGCVNESGCLTIESEPAHRKHAGAHTTSFRDASPWTRARNPYGRKSGRDREDGFRVRSQSCSRPGMTMDVMTPAARYTHNVVPAQVGTTGERPYITREIVCDASGHPVSLSPASGFRLVPKGQLS
jgi:hypothetical protein